MKITLKDGSVKEYSEAKSVYDIAKDISEGLARVACAGEVNGEIVDLRTVLENDCELNIVTASDAEGLKVIRHTASHVLAQAVKRLFPNAKITIGPAIEDGFYYEQDYNNKSYKIDYDYNYLMDKYLVSIDAKDLSEFSEKFYSCLKHLESIDFSEFDLCLDPNDIYADDLPNGCKEGDEFLSLLNVFSNFVKESGGFFTEDLFDIDSLITNYKNRNYVYVGQAIEDKSGSFRLSSVDDIDLFMDDYERMLCERGRCFYRFYFVACELHLKKIS